MAVEFPTFLLVSVSTQCVYIRLPTVSSDKVDLEFQINLFSRLTAQVILKNKKKMGRRFEIMMVR